MKSGKSIVNARCENIEKYYESQLSLPHDVRGEVSICRCCEASGHHLHHLHDFRGQADLLEAQLFCNFPDGLFVIRKDGCMLEHNGNALDA